MIKLFRKFRQQLLSKNKFSSYLLYAFGEIILVVIGILIAITLNSNYQNKSSKTDRDVKLLKLRHLIYNDSIVFAESIQNSRILIDQIDSLQELLDPEMDYNDYKNFVEKFKEVDIKFRTFDPNTTVYNELINSANFSKIENEALKDKISTLYSYYDHFGNLINNFTNGFIATYYDLYSQGIISYKYYHLDLTEEEMEEGYKEFKVTIQDPQKRRIIENYFYGQRDLHTTIASMYQGITAYFMRGLPISPNN